MNAVDAVALLASGYVSGLSISSGFILSLIHQFFVKDRHRRRQVAWILAMVSNMALCTLGAVFVMVFLVYGKDAGRFFFWQRLGVFVIGVSLGALFVMAAVRLMNLKLREPA